MLSSYYYLGVYLGKVKKYKCSILTQGGSKKCDPLYPGPEAPPNPHHNRVKDIFEATIKGSKNYKKILQSNSKMEKKPSSTININWNMEGKYNMNQFMKKVYTFWKTLYLQSTLQNLHYKQHC
jgi:hypothetical protein